MPLTSGIRRYRGPLLNTSCRPPFQSLEQIDIAAKLLDRAAHVVIENPLDAQYHTMRCTMEPLDKTSDLFQTIQA